MIEYSSFPVRLSGSILSGGVTAFGWIEQSPSASGLQAYPGARTGHPFSGTLGQPAYEINNFPLTADGSVIAMLSPRGYVQGAPVWEFSLPLATSPGVRDSLTSGKITGGDATGCSGLSTHLLHEISGNDTSVVLKGVDFLPTQNRWKGIIDSEQILFEGTSGGISQSGGLRVDIVQRGVDGTTATGHSGGNAVAVAQQIPTIVSGIQTTIFEKGQFVYPSSGNSLTVVPQTQTVRVLSATPKTIKNISHYSGRVETYDWTEVSGSNYKAEELCWVVDRNAQTPSSGLRYDGMFAGYSASGPVAPIYLIDQPAAQSVSLSGVVGAQPLFGINYGLSDTVIASGQTLHLLTTSGASTFSKGGVAGIFALHGSGYGIAVTANLEFNFLSCYAGISCYTSGTVNGITTLNVLKTFSGNVPNPAGDSVNAGSSEWWQGGGAGDSTFPMGVAGGYVDVSGSAIVYLTVKNLMRGPITVFGGQLYVIKEGYH